MKTLAVFIFGIFVISPAFCDDYPQGSLADEYAKQEASRKPQSKKPSECDGVDWNEINAAIEANKNPICKNVNKPGHMLTIDENQAGCSFTKKFEALKKKCKK